MNTNAWLISLVSGIYVLNFGHSSFLSFMEDRIGRAIGIEFTNFKVRSPMLCAAECMKRKRCKFFGQKGEKCGFQKGAILPKMHTCRELRDFIVNFPSALAGACSDHNCGLAQTCEAKKGGGYTCKKG